MWIEKRSDILGMMIKVHSETGVIRTDDGVMYDKKKQKKFFSIPEKKRKLAHQIIKVFDGEIL